MVTVTWSNHKDANCDGDDGEEEEDFAFDFNDGDDVFDLMSLFDNLINAYACTAKFSMENMTEAGSCIPIYLTNGHFP